MQSRDLLNIFYGQGLDFPGGSVVKNQPASAGDAWDTGSIHGPRGSLEEEMATHSGIAWKIPWTEEPGGLQSIGLQRVRHSWATKHIAPMWASTHILSLNQKFKNVEHEFPRFWFRNTGENLSYFMCGIFSLYLEASWKHPGEEEGERLQQVLQAAWQLRQRPARKVNMAGVD